MEEVEKEYSNNLNLDFNEQDNNPSNINENENTINEIEKDKKYMETLKKILDDNDFIDFLIEQVEILRQDKEKLLNLFSESKLKRENENIITEFEKLLLENIFYHYEKQIIMNNEKVLNEKGEDNDLNKILFEVKKNRKKDIHDNDIYEILNSSINKDTDLNRDDININSPCELFQDEKIDHYKELRVIFNFLFKIGNTNEYEGLHLHKSFICLTMLNCFYYFELFALKGMEDFSIPSIYGMIIFFAFTLYIFYKLFFKKYDENYKEKNCIWNYN